MCGCQCCSAVPSKDIQTTVPGSAGFEDLFLTQKNSWTSSGSHSIPFCLLLRHVETRQVYGMKVQITFCLGISDYSKVLSIKPVSIHRMVWLGRDLKNHLITNPLHGQEHLPTTSNTGCSMPQPTWPNLSLICFFTLIFSPVALYFLSFKLVFTACLEK